MNTRQSRETEITNGQNEACLNRVTRELRVANRLGLHARPCSKWVRLASQFQCDVWVEKDGEEVNGKSIMGLMMLAAGSGSVLNVTCHGLDADSALAALEALAERKFDED